MLELEKTYSVETETAQSKFPVSTLKNKIYVVHKDHGTGYIYSAYREMFYQTWKYMVAFHCGVETCAENEIELIKKSVL